jgi:hypothetical protein
MASTARTEPREPAFFIENVSMALSCFAGPTDHRPASMGRESHAGAVARCSIGNKARSDPPGIVALIDSGLTDVPVEARNWLASVAQFARLAYARGVGLTFMIGGRDR